MCAGGVAVDESIAFGFIGPALLRAAWVARLQMADGNCNTDIASKNVYNTLFAVPVAENKMQHPVAMSDGFVYHGRLRWLT